MPPEDARHEDTRAWIDKARTDLAAGHHAMTADPPFLGDAAFHAQQAAEKALKALLVWHDEPFRRTHSLTELGEQCTRLDPSLAATLEAASPLSEYASRFRYPGDYAPPTADEAREALAVAGEVVAAVESRVPGTI